MRHAAALVVLVAALTTARPTPARADLGSSIYDDVRDVVEELIRSEIAGSVVATIRTRSPGVGFYFDDTLERLASPYWGSLPRVFRDDLTVAVADYTYFHLTSGGDATDLDRSLARFFKCTALASEPGADCDRLRAALLTARHPLLDEECVRTAPSAGRRVACDLGLATRAALSGKGAARRHVMDAVADVVLADVEGPLGPRLREILLAWLDRPDTVPTDLIEQLSVTDLIAALDDQVLARVCGDKDGLRRYLENPASAPGWACFAVSAAQLPDAAVMTIAITEATQTTTEKLAFWRLSPVLATIPEADFGDNAIYGALAEAAFNARCKGSVRSEALAREWPCSGKRLGVGAVVAISWLGLDLVAKVDADGKLRGEVPKEMARWMRRWQRVTAELDRIKATLPVGLRSILFVPDTGGASAAATLRATVRMTRLAARIKERWYLWSTDARDAGDLDVGELLDLAREAAALGRDAGADAIRELGGIGGDAGRDLADWFRLIVKADHRTLAIDLLRAGLELAADRAGRPQERFFISLAAYVLDATDGDTEAMTRSAFRAAAKDLLLSVETHGLPREGSRWRGRLVPRLSLRFAVNDQQAVSGADRRRTVVSADWPTAMVAVNDYAGLEVSLLDPIAPLAELGLRDAGDYADGSLLVLDAVRPRVGVWVGVPQLSRRLALSLGAGARLVGVDRTSDPAAVTPAFRYVRRTSLTVDLGVELVF